MGSVEAILEASYLRQHNPVWSSRPSIQNLKLQAYELCVADTEFNFKFTEFKLKKSCLHYPTYQHLKNQEWTLFYFHFSATPAKSANENLLM